MPSLEAHAIIDSYEWRHHHRLSISQWIDLLWSISDEFHSARPISGETFISHEHRVQVYCARADAGEDLFHPDDVQPPLTVADLQWADAGRKPDDDDDADQAAGELAGGDRQGEEPRRGRRHSRECPDWRARLLKVLSTQRKKIEKVRRVDARAAWHLDCALALLGGLEEPPWIGAELTPVDTRGGCQKAAPSVIETDTLADTR